jgi:hypothetical protein
MGAALADQDGEAVGMRPEGINPVLLQPLRDGNVLNEEEGWVEELESTIGIVLAQDRDDHVARAGMAANQVGP